MLSIEIKLPKDIYDSIIDKIHNQLAGTQEYIDNKIILSQGSKDELKKEGIIGLYIETENVHETKMSVNFDHVETPIIIEQYKKVRDDVTKFANNSVNDN